VTTFMFVIWKFVCLFIEKETQQKVHLSRHGTEKDLQDFFQPNQLLQKYGGTAPEPPTYWPPFVPPGPFVKDPDTLASDEVYKKILDENPYL